MNIILGNFYDPTNKKLFERVIDWFFDNGADLVSNILEKSSFILLQGEDKTALKTFNFLSKIFNKLSIEDKVEIMAAALNSPHDSVFIGALKLLPQFSIPQKFEIFEAREKYPIYGIVE